MTPERGVAEVERIWTKRARRGPMDPVQEVQLRAGDGIVGDANRGGRRQVTVISREAWDRMVEEIEAPVDPIVRRANFLVRGIDLVESRGRILSLGPCRIRIEGQTRPCHRMEEAHPGLEDAMRSEWRGGVYGVVLEGGAVRTGDRVALSPGLAPAPGRAPKP